MRRPQPSMIVALAALVVAATGPADAALTKITSSQIKDNTIVSRDIKNGTIAVADISKSARAALADGPGRVQLVTSQSPDVTGSVKFLSVDCPAGTSLTGGSATVGGASGASVTSSAPTATGWTAAANFSGPTQPWVLTVYALCASRGA